jgi:MFS family permease
MPILIIAIAAMLVQQTIATTAKLGMPAMFPTIAGDLGFDPKFALAYTFGYAVCAILVMAGCGGALKRWGALRTSQIGCVLMALGLSLAALMAQPWFAIPPLVLAVIINSGGSTVATPASSQILAKYAPIKWAPLVFSIKQTGVPAGLAISGIILAPIAVAYGWRAALLGLALVCLLIAVLLQPLRAEFDADRDPTARPRFRDFPDTVREVLSTTELRGLAIASFCFVGMQAVFMGFSVTYLHEVLHYAVEEAGPLFGAAALVAVPARIFWGWVGSTVIRPRYLLACLAMMMGVSTAAMGAFADTWSETEIVAVFVVVSLSVLSWHGVLLSEAARLAKPGEAGRMTGGVLAFGSAGQVVFPLLFGAGLFIDGYQLAYIAIGLPAMFVGQMLARAEYRSR